VSAPYQYIVLHQSCRNRYGILAVQAAHAAAESIRSLPVDPETNVVALMAERSDDLEQLSEALKLVAIHHVVIREPDEPYRNKAVAVGVEPVKDGARKNVQAIVSSMGLTILK
jgi:predicted transcriptional regulator